MGDRTIQVTDAKESKALELGSTVSVTGKWDEERGTLSEARLSPANVPDNWRSVSFSRHAQMERSGREVTIWDGHGPKTLVATGEMRGDIEHAIKLDRPFVVHYDVQNRVVKVKW